MTGGQFDDFLETIPLLFVIPPLWEILRAYSSCQGRNPCLCWYVERARTDETAGTCICCRVWSLALFNIPWVWVLKSHTLRPWTTRWDANLKALCVGGPVRSHRSNSETVRC